MSSLSQKQKHIEASTLARYGFITAEECAHRCGQQPDFTQAESKKMAAIYAVKLLSNAGYDYNDMVFMMNNSVDQVNTFKELVKAKKG